jgi:hypothetical protein
MVTMKVRVLKLDFVSVRRQHISLLFCSSVDVLHVTYFVVALLSSPDVMYVGLQKVSLTAYHCTISEMLFLAF